MFLQLSSGVEINLPSDREMRQALASLDVQRDGEGFAILSRTEMTYVQVSGDRTVGFVMEYQEDSVDEHFRAQREDYSLDEVVQAFAAYRDGTIVWSDFGEWSRIDV